MSRRARLLGIGLLATLGACFSPREPACAFSCANNGPCPPDYVCGSDNLCHRADDAGVCLFEPVDGGDGGPD
jgi:hypothetical protein